MVNVSSEHIMTIFKTPTLGTDPVSGWQYYALHMSGYYIISEFLNVGRYVTSLNRLEGNGFATIKAIKSTKTTNTKLLIATEKELVRWAKDQREEGYHELYSHSFISMWSAFESGIENILSSFIENDKKLAEKISQISKLKLDINTWPWPRDECLRIADRLSKKIGNEQQDYKYKLVALFSYIEIEVEPNSETHIKECVLSEANEVRNIILHSYGKVRLRDADKIPSLEPWIDKTIVMNQDKFNDYYNSMSQFICAIMTGISSSRYTTKKN